MKRAWILFSAALSCGDDGAAASDTDASDSTGTGTSSAQDTGPTSASGDTTETTETSTSSADTTTSDASSSSSSGTATSGAESGSSESSSSTGGQGDGCLPPEVFAAIDQHAHDLVSTAELLASHPSENEVTGFLLAPGLPEPPSLTASFAGPLVMTCSDPLLYDEFCEEGRCMQIECTGQGPGWINHVWVEPAIAGEWSFDEVHLHLNWSGGSGVTFDITTTSTAPGGEDMSLVGAGEMDVASMSVIETFPALHVAGDTVLEYADDVGGFSGQLTIADVVVAEVDVAGHLEPTGECP